MTTDALLRARRDALSLPRPSQRDAAQRERDAEKQRRVFRTVLQKAFSLGDYADEVLQMSS